MSENILLTEANYKDKFPPLGLMKIATFHNLKGDRVIYSREKIREHRTFFSKIYIGTRFSFHWKRTSELIRYYQNNFGAEILIGGIHSTINPTLYEREFGIKPVIGTYKGDISPVLDSIKQDKNLSVIIDEIIKFGIDALPPDYSIFDGQHFPFSKIVSNYYLLRATKGCKRKCSFCDVKIICEGYVDKIQLKPIVNYINQHFGLKNHVLLFDDNTLMSSCFENIISDLHELGFSKTNGDRNTKICDFNQGLDLRLLDDSKIDLINQISIDPLRFAFDDISVKDTFINNLVKVINSGAKNISVYVLYNYKDTPQDFYERLKISIELNTKYKCRIFSFPMKYINNGEVDRKYLGKHWTRRMIRGVQCILNSSHGIVPVSEVFFNQAFGKNFEEFYRIIHMPEKYIIYRKENNLEILKWNTNFNRFSFNEKKVIIDSISGGKGKIIFQDNINPQITDFLNQYRNEL